jgi:glycosyltransferase involved in cell wall biosynthesis
MSQDRYPTRQNTALVSVIMPVWNPRSDWLAAAIDSAFHESRCQIELMLVDDGSDDPPEAWLSPGDAERVHLIRGPHRGVGHARNLALDRCSGEFVRFLDADDIILPDSTSTLLDLTEGAPNVAAYGSTLICDPCLRPQGVLRSRLRGSVHFPTAIGRFRCTLPAMVIPRQSAVQVGGFDDRLIVQGDWDFVLRASESLDFRGTTEPVYLYRRHKKSLTSSAAARREAVRSTVLIIKGYLARHPELQGTRAEVRVRAYAQFLIAKLRNPECPMCGRSFWKATAVDPIRGLPIAVSRTAAVGARTIRALISRI